MSKKPAEPLRGEDAWKAARSEIAKKNDAACDRARKSRAARHAEVKAMRLAEERADLANAQRVHPQAG